MVFNITIVYAGGTSSSITNFKAENKNAALIDVVNRNSDFRDEEIVSITIFERVQKDF